MGSDDTAGKVLFDINAAKAPRTPTEAAAFLAGELARGGVQAVHVMVFRVDGTFGRALFGEMQLALLAWAAEYTKRDAMLLNDHLDAAAVRGGTMRPIPGPEPEK